MAENKAIMRRLYSGISQGNLDVIDELIAADVIEHEALPPGLPEGRAGVMAFFALMRSAFADFTMTVEDVIAEGDKVVCRVTMRGTHVGEFMGIAPSGRAIAVQGIDINRIAGGQVVEHWGQSDDMGMLMQLGALPAPAADNAG